jgi:SAM-dependent methyltransferase
MNQLDLVKLRFYYEHVLTQVYSEGISPAHRHITKDVISKFVEPMKLKADAKILDLGCGPGYFLEDMRQRGYTNLTGITLSPDDFETCQSQQLPVRMTDFNFLQEADESVDLLFCRHGIEHSPFPFITLLEFNRVLRPGGKLYIEVPQPDNERPHEHNQNHYSVFGRTMWLSLLQRTGFDVEWYDYQMPLKFQDDSETWTEKFFVFVCTRRRSVDVK